MKEVNNMMLLLILEAMINAGDDKLNEIYTSLTGSNFDWHAGDLHVNLQEVLYEATVLDPLLVKAHLQEMLDIIK